MDGKELETIAVRSHTRMRAALALLSVVLLSWVVGCGNALYAIQVNQASSRLEEAKELGAEELAAYEYWVAFEHLEKARTEAAEADYSDAINFAEVSEEYATKAIELARQARRGAGR